jgi:hypothetical protein
MPRILRRCRMWNDRAPRPDGAVRSWNSPVRDGRHSAPATSALSAGSAEVPALEARAGRGWRQPRRPRRGLRQASGDLRATAWITFRCVVCGMSLRPRRNRHGIPEITPGIVPGVAVFDRARRLRVYYDVARRISLTPRKRRVPELTIVGNVPIADFLRARSRRLRVYYDVAVRRRPRYLEGT